MRFATVDRLIVATIVTLSVCAVLALAFFAPWLFW
jgi:hypothetical protein